MLLDLSSLLAAYLIGSVSTAVLVCRLAGLPDPRADGSGNPGATNVLRLGGKLAAAETLAGDVLKGVIPVLAARWLGAGHALAAAVCLAAFLGHVFPVFFQFRGGKGVATALGAITAFAWPVGLAMALTWLLVALTWRYASLSSIAAGALAPLYAAIVHIPPVAVALLATMSAVLIVRHRANIARLLAGTENRIDARASTP